MRNDKLKSFLDEKVELYNQPNFIEFDPVSIPHRFSKPQDIEISGFFAATLAWGLRKTIINKCTELMNLMDNAPFDFITNHHENDLKPLIEFKHRTFNATDLLYFIHFLKTHYRTHSSLEEAFIHSDSQPSRPALSQFHSYFFDDPIAPKRTRKHVASPDRKSSCKRLNMFLRWMVRKDNNGVDFGIWNSISPSKLLCPLDIHVGRTARKLGLIKRKQNDWQTTLELTQKLSDMDPIDPVKYDFALFGLGVIEKF